MLTDILAISGQSGLFKLVSNTKNAIIVENIETKKRLPSYASSKVSSLKDISIYTDDNDLPLEELMLKIKETSQNQQVLSHKSSADELKTFFEEVIPNYDKDRVYVSDIKKVIQWYNILQKNDLINPKEEDKNSETKE